MSNQDANGLSDRELEILKLVATGASNKEIAQKLYISSNTVKVHLRNIFTKIGANSRTEAAMYAVRIGITETISPQLNNMSDELLGAKPGIQTEILSLSSLRKNRRSVLYLGLIGILISFLTFGYWFLHHNNILSFTPPSPTATQRVQWFKSPGPPTPRSGMAVVNFENKIYAIGGENAQGISNSVECYNPQTSIWTDLSNKPIPVTDADAAVIGGHIYVPGGRLATGQPTNIMEIYDPVSNLWSQGKPLPKPLSAYALAVFEGLMYIAGGWDGNQVVSDAYVYDYHTDSWANIQPLPTARSYAGAAVIGGKVYIIGGWNGSTASTADEAFIPDNSKLSSSWIQEPALPYGRYAMGVTNLADIIFVIGGLGANENPSTIALSPGDTNWVQLESPINKGWSFLAASTVGTRLYALGGKNGAELNKDMWSYQAIFTITFPIIR